RRQFRDQRPGRCGRCRWRLDRSSGGTAHQLHRIDRGGRIVARRAAENLKPCLLELGGKAPLVVLDDADLDEAVKAAAFGAFMNQGQICMSTERIIVVDSVAAEFSRRFAAKAKTLVAGDPRANKTPLGAVVDAKAL